MVLKGIPLPECGRREAGERELQVCGRYIVSYFRVYKYLEFQVINNLGCLRLKGQKWGGEERAVAKIMALQTIFRCSESLDHCKPSLSVSCFRFCSRDLGVSGSKVRSSGA